MCQQIIQFCSGSTKPLMFAGGFLTLLLAFAIGYIGYDANCLYHTIDPSVSEAKSLGYYLQLVAAGYLVVITVLSCFAAYFDQKHSIRGMAVITSINFVLAVAAILMAPSGDEIGTLFKDRLTKAQELYDFDDKIPTQPSNQPSVGDPVADSPKARSTRDASTAPSPQSPPITKEPQVSPNKTESTKIWDALQQKGCCGYNSPSEWKQKIPKTCCAPESIDKDTNKCLKVDEKHNKGCIEVIKSTSLHLLLVLALIAFVNLYLATVTGISTYRTFHYNEASQNAYN